MKKLNPFGDVGRRYEAAHEAHYVAKDLGLAMELYQGVLTSHPNSREADFSRTQVRNIANSIVPKKELMDGEITLVLAHLANMKLHDPLGSGRQQVVGPEI